MTAIETCEKLEALMWLAANGAPYARDARACEDAAHAAFIVSCYLRGCGYWGGPAPTREQAQKAAMRAWGGRVPDDVRSALCMSAA
jgi:hypothetical protein